MSPEGEQDGGISRRNFLRLGGALAALTLTIGVAESLDSSSPNKPKHQAVVGVPTTIGEVENYQDYPPVFENDAAEKIAEELGVTPGAYYQVPQEVVTKMTGGAFLSDKLSPIFPPSVRQYEPLIVDISEKFDVPPNFLATIMTIESSGDANAASGSNAFGLMQVVPEDHFGSFGEYLPDEASLDDYLKASAGQKSKVSMAKYQEVFTDPKVNITVGARYLAGCVTDAKQTDNLQSPNINPVSFAWAGAYYNAGTGYSGQPFNSLPLQSQLYVDHIIRILMDVEIANRLVSDGMSGEDVVQNMSSQQMNARAYAYGQYGQTYPSSTFDDYNQRASYLALRVPGLSDVNGMPLRPYGKQVHEWYEQYLKGDVSFTTENNQTVDRYVIPASPGLRIWLEGGGDSLFDAQADNANWR